MDHCKCVEPDKKTYLPCNYCGKKFHGGVYRMKHHLARDHDNAQPCMQAPEEVYLLFSRLLKEKKNAKRDEENDLADYIDMDDADEMRITGSNLGKRKLMSASMDAFVTKGKKQQQTTINSHFKKDDRDKVCLDICRFFYRHCLAFHLVKSSFFATMAESIAAYGKGLKLPSYHEIRNKFLKLEVDLTNDKLKVYKEQWKKTGCTIMSGGWTDQRRRTIVNFLVNSPRGTVILKSVDASDVVKDANTLFKMLDEVIEEVGEENVVQIVTDSASNYVKAGKMLEEKIKKLFWSPCGAHILDLVLSDIGDMDAHRDTVEKAKKISLFIYKHSWLLNLMRTHTKGKELVRPAVTRFATQYLSLRSMLENRGGLKRMFASSDWETCDFSRSTEGIRVEKIVLEDSRFWNQIKYCLKSTIPLVKVLRLLDGDEKPAMGYIYEAMDQAKEKIAKNFGDVNTRYQPFWDIIDTRWNAQLHRPLHGAGMYLNPKYQYDHDMDMEVKKGLFDCIEKMIPDRKERTQISRQLDFFANAEGEFGRTMAIESRKAKQPALWWQSFGSHCPELQKFAIRVLSLTCSATGCERNWSTFDQIHSKKRNKLERKRLNALVFVKYNLQLEERHDKRIERNALDPICLSDMESDDEWITEKEDPALPQDNDWMDIGECFHTEEGEASKKVPKKKKRGPRNTQYKGKGKAVMQDEDEDEDDYGYSSEANDEEDEEDDDAEDQENATNRDGAAVFDVDA